MIFVQMRSVVSKLSCKLSCVTLATALAAPNGCGDMRVGAIEWGGGGAGSTSNNGNTGKSSSTSNTGSTSSTTGSSSTTSTGGCVPGSSGPGDGVHPSDALCDLGGFKSSATCKGCHESIYKDWAFSMHSRSLLSPVATAQMNQIYKLELKDLGAPDPQRVCVACSERRPTTSVTAIR